MYLPGPGDLHRRRDLSWYRRSPERYFFISTLTFQFGLNHPSSRSRRRSERLRTFSKFFSQLLTCCCFDKNSLSYAGSLQTLKFDGINFFTCLILNQELFHCFIKEFRRFNEFIRFFITHINDIP